MKLLLDTHVLLWAAAGSGLSPATLDLLNDEESELHFSAASIWEIAIKSSLGRPEFDLDPGVFRRELFEAGYEEIAINGSHAAAVSTLPDLHKDPFDRILVAQAIVEGVTLISADRALLAYPGPLRPAD